MYISIFVETYREYKKVKSCVSGEGNEEKKVKRVHFEDDTGCQRSSPPPSQSTKEDAVFGVSLNKKPKKKKVVNGDFYVGGKREGEGERKSVWKLRRWSKGRGHHTVMVKKEEEGEGDGREGEHIREEKDKEMAASRPNNENTSNKVCMYMRYSILVNTRIFPFLMVIITCMPVLFYTAPFSGRL